MDIVSVAGTILFSAAVSTVKELLVSAVKAGADLYDADLYGANLRGADLYGATLSGANLYCADLHGADLHGADLHDADLRGANLRGADLHGADLHGADLCGANLRGADLHGADLHGAKNASVALARIQFIPEEGSFIGWKKCKDGVIVKLSIAADAKRSHASTRKCRASKVEVIDVFGADYGVSGHDGKTEYRVGSIVEPDSFDDDRWNECSNGIHFFLTRLEAEEYSL